VFFERGPSVRWDWDGGIYTLFLREGCSNDWEFKSVETGRVIVTCASPQVRVPIIIFRTVWLRAMCSDSENMREFPEDASPEFGHVSRFSTPSDRLSRLLKDIFAFIQDNSQHTLPYTLIVVCLFTVQNQ